MLDILFITLSIICGLLFINYQIRKENLYYFRTLTYGLFLYHLMIGLIYGAYVLTLKGDAVMFWSSPALRSFSTNWPDLFEPGSKFIYFLTFPFSQVLKLNYWTGCVIFSTIGFIGIMYFFSLMVRHVEFNPTIFGIKIFPLIFFLPNLHFWSVGIGKDAVVFFSITLFFYSISRRLNWVGLFSALFITYYVRPHMAFILILAVAISSVLSSEMKLWPRTIIILLMLSGSYFILDDLIAYLKIEDLSYGSLEELGNTKMYYLSRGETGSKIDMGSYPFLYKIFTFFYRPLFYDINNALAIVASFENLIYLLLSIKLFQFNPFKYFSASPLFIKAGLITVFASAIAFTGFLSNLGIILRMKNMVMFMLVITISYLISEHYKKENLPNQVW